MKILDTKDFSHTGFVSVRTGHKPGRRKVCAEMRIIMRRRWGLRGGACLLACMLLTGCAGTAEETGAESAGQAQEEAVEAVDKDAEKTYYALPTEAEESEI